MTHQIENQNERKEKLVMKKNDLLEAHVLKEQELLQKKKKWQVRTDRLIAQTDRKQDLEFFLRDLELK